MPQIYEKGLFSIDGLDGPYEGYSSGEHWNGWACPVFERDEAKRIAASFRTQSERHGLPGEFEARFDEDADAFLFRDPEDDPLRSLSESLTT